MAYSARVLLDSTSPAGVRLTTLEVTFPRFVLSEFNTHRVFCLDGDTQLHFAGQTPMLLRDLYDRWHDRASLGIARARLASMPLRCCNEATGEIVQTHVRDVY